jgi:hypothetical protein
MTHVMFLLLMIAWFVLGAATMVVVAALGRAGHVQDELRAAGTVRLLQDAAQPVASAA